MKSIRLKHLTGLPEQIYTIAKQGYSAEQIMQSFNLPVEALVFVTICMAYNKRGNSKKAVEEYKKIKHLIYRFPPNPFDV